MKKIFTSLAVILVGLGLFVQPTFALDLGLESAKNAAAGAGYDAAGTTDTTLAQNIGSFIRGILTVSGVIFTCLVFYAGYLWMTARGDEGQVDKAKEIIRAGVIGLTISLAAFGITNLVMKLVSGGATGNGGAGGGASGSCQAKSEVVAGCTSIKTNKSDCETNPEFVCSWVAGACQPDAWQICPQITSSAECALQADNPGCVYVQ